MSVDWNKSGGLLNFNWNPCYPGPYVDWVQDNTRITMKTEPGPGCIFTSLFFWAFPCYLREVRADRFTFSVTDSGTIICEVRSKTAFQELPVRVLQDVTATRIYCTRTETDENEEQNMLPYTPCVFVVIYDGGQFRCLEGAGKFDRVIHQCCDAINELIQNYRTSANDIPIPIYPDAVAVIVPSSTQLPPPSADVVYVSAPGGYDPPEEYNI